MDLSLSLSSDELSKLKIFMNYSDSFKAANILGDHTHMKGGHVIY